MEFNSPVVFDPFSGRVGIFAYGAPANWNIKQFQKNGDHLKNPELYSRITTIAEDLGITRFLAPRPSLMNAQICQPEDLTEAIGDEDEVIISRGIDADGCEIPIDHGYWLSSADCITIVMQSPVSGKVIAAHAGLKSLYDCGRLEDSLPTRKGESVVYNMVAQYPKEEIALLKVFTTCGINPTHYTHSPLHPEYGEKNKKLIAHIQEHWQSGVIDYPSGKIWLHGIIRDQLLEVGVKDFNLATDGIDTFGDTNARGAPLWHSNRRSQSATDKEKRNGIVVVRNW